MKSSQQQLTMEKYPYSAPSPFDIRCFCQQQVEQFVTLPIAAAWIVYNDPKQEHRQSVVYYPPNSGGSYPQLSDLESHGCKFESLPTLSLREVATAGGLKAFVCLLDLYCCEPEYLLLWANAPLSAQEKHWTEQQMQLLLNHLVIYREYSRQQAEIQLLEQVVRRAEHQLRNPLAMISLYAENLCLGSPAGRLKEQAMLIRETVDDLSTNLTDLLYCGQQEKLRVAPHDLWEIVGQSIKGLQPLLEQKQLQILCSQTPVTLAVDRWQIKQVFDNLLSNAVYFSPQMETVTCNWTVFRDEVLIEVLDQGPGLSEEDLKQAFTPFYSRRPRGTGLGLAIAKKIILDHKGRLWVQNQ
ncbi:MAG TPA: sensor histidine kinase, partial [Cyanobacteria bacterium UBA8543]|nr:sensor histidine kinase [Cyanobacteria bacterium UBA8543]